MTTWTKLNIGLDANLANAVSQINQIAGTATSALDAAAAVISTAEGLIVTNLDPLETAARTAVTTVQDVINDYFASGGYLLIAHPYTQGINPNLKTQGLFQALSAPNALKLAINKLHDTADPRRPDFSTSAPLDAVALLIGSSNPDGFQDIIESFHALLNFDELAYLLEKMKQIKRLEQEQLQRNIAPQMPLWNAIKANDIKPLDALQDSLNEGLNTLQSFTIEPALSALKKALATKKEQLATLKKHLATVQNALTGGIAGTGAYQLKIQASGTNGVAHALKQASGLPGHELGFCAICLFVAGQGDLKIITKLFQ